MNRLVLIALMLSSTYLASAAEPTIPELEWHKAALEAKLQRDHAQNQVLQLDVAALTAELATVTAQLEKAKTEAEVKAKPPEPPK